ncbi:MAG TPA: zinc ribbon domain-containing protein [Symbiobacteriaceae bacterium]|jgi:hypothetical protein|nr:zinc ribbon domain-containing protein [Symbiobacteriaceae bacterium]
MATCSRCGNANVSGKFCGTCGAPVSQQAAGAMPTPPPPPGPQQGWQQPTPPQVPNQPQPFPNQPPQSWQQPAYGPAPVPPKKGGAGKVIGIIAGVVVGLIVLLFVVVALLPDDPTPQPPTPTPTADKTNQPATPPANQPATAKAYPAKVLAQGTFDFTNFTSYDGFGGFQVAFARNNGDNLEMAVYEFADGQFRKAVEAFYQHGALQDVNHGEIFNDGNDLAIVSAEKGITLIDEVGNTQPLDGRTARHMLVGDWDADGNVETMTVLQKTDGYTFDIQRYKTGSQPEKLKSMANFKFVGSPQVVKLADSHALILGMAPDQAAGGLGMQALQVNLDSGTFSQYGLWTVPESNEAVVVGYAATNLNGKDTLLVSYKGAQSHVELFDISKKGAYAPASLGTIKLPDGAGYSLILGKFTQNKSLEVFAFTPDGKFLIYGF